MTEQLPAPAGATFTPLLCYQCGMLLGVDLGAVLILGAVRVERTITFACQGCRAVRKWVPAPVVHLTKHRPAERIP